MKSNVLLIEPDCFAYIAGSHLNMKDNQTGLSDAQIVPLFSSGCSGQQTNATLDSAINGCLTTAHQAQEESLSDFDRNVYCLMGIPIDAVDMDSVLLHVKGAAFRRHQCFLSTPNLNFLVGCQRDAKFRESLINSDLSIADGLPLSWMARRLGIPLQSRVAGSDLFEVLMAGKTEPGQRLKVFFFGGREGVAEAASEKLGAGAYGLRGCGYLYPGHGSVEELSAPEMIEQINASGADILVVSLGARKGQDWIERNRHQLNVPVMSHLGAVVNFVAGTVDRAPRWVRRIGMEWLWRIKEEPSLWRRYWSDGLALVRLLLTRLLPYLIWQRLSRIGVFPVSGDCQSFVDRVGDRIHLGIVGSTPETISATLRDTVRQAATMKSPLIVDLSKADYLSPAFFGMLLLLRKHQHLVGKPMTFVGLSGRLKRLFRWSGVDYLLAGHQKVPAVAFNQAITDCNDVVMQKA